ncbi:MAG: DNA mismatch repair protein MutS [Chlamydiales bacterium]
MIIKQDKKLTPMMEQWKQCKEKAGDALLLFRLGDFYEAFYEDASLLANAVDLTLTQRQGIPMSGIPYHAAESYIEKLVQKGFLVAIAEQIGDPRHSIGIVERDIVRIISPATIINSSFLHEKSHNYFAAIAVVQSIYGLAFLDISTGEFSVIQSKHEHEIIDEISHRNPAEILITESLERTLHAQLMRLKSHNNFRLHFETDNHTTIGYTSRTITDHFNTHSLQGLGLIGRPALVTVAGMLLHHIRDRLHQPINHIQRITQESFSSFMRIDQTTERNLELFTPSHPSKNSPTLFSSIDFTITAMGGRLLKYFLSHPLRSTDALVKRQDAIEEFVNHPSPLVTLRLYLKKICDLERIIMRIQMQQCTPKDFIALRSSLSVIPQIAKELSIYRTYLIEDIRNNLVDISILTNLLYQSLVEDPPLRVGDKPLFNKGYHSDLDTLYDLVSDDKTFVTDYRDRLQRELGIKTLRISYNKVFGYFIEVSQAHAHKMPKEFLRKQTLSNTERFISPILKEYEHKILSAEEKITELEQYLYSIVKTSVSAESPAILQIAKAIAHLDAWMSLAHVAMIRGFSRPTLYDSDEFTLGQSKHPVLMSVMPPHTFISNEVKLDCNHNRLSIITGPNMAGKSTYIRQIALIAILAQIGSFIPAESAKIGLIDQVFSRIGASDDLTRGYSTFMVEMMETAHILHNATKNSLVILDEIGRGTSTYDGIAIAWSVSEFLLNTVGCKTLFATHYYELTELENTFTGVQNYCMAIEEQGDNITFLRKIISGGTDKSYGIYVAKIAGLPTSVIAHAKILLEKLLSSKSTKNLDIQSVPLPIPNPHPIIKQLQTIDLNSLTPIQALQLLMDWKNEL